MKRFLLKILYLKYPKVFHDLMVEDFIGQIPKDVKEPSIAFLSKGKDVLTRYFLFQAYSIQRRAVADVQNTERFHGMLIMMKFLISLVENSQSRVNLDANITEEEEKPDPLKAVGDFVSGMKERKIKK